MYDEGHSELSMSGVVGSLSLPMFSMLSITAMIQSQFQTLSVYCHFLLEKFEKPVEIFLFEIQVYNWLLVTCPITSRT